MKSNLLYSPWCYKISIRYQVDEKVYCGDFSIITRKNYSDIHEDFPKFIMRDVKHFFHEYDVIFLSADIVDLYALYW